MIERDAMEIGTLVTTAFRLSSAKYREEHERWIKRSHLASPTRPNSMLSVIVQRCGEIDILLRGMENERLTRIQNNVQDDPAIDPFHHQCMLSEIWVGALYAVVRMLTTADKKAPIDDLHHHLRLIRVGIEKLEIAGDRALKAPLEMEARGMGAPPRAHSYDKSDPTRSHIMPTGISPRGSLMWQVIDLKASSVFWLERQDLADRFLACSGGS